MFEDHSIAGFKADSVPAKVLILLFETFIISLLTFVLGYFFAKRSLKPSEDMLLRLEQFTTDASHELKTPLTVVGTSLELAKKTKDYEKYINKAQVSLREANDLVYSLLELAKTGKESALLETVNVRLVVEEVLNEKMEEIDSRQLKVISDLKDSLQKCDITMCKRVIINLLDNAIKFNHSGGSIFLYLNTQELAISNNGSGIQGDVSKVFDRFYQQEESRKQSGYGIGLSLVKQICEIHHWKISVKSNKELTTFRVGF